MKEVEIVNYVILDGENKRIDTVGEVREKQLKKQLSQRAENSMKELKAKNKSR